MNVRGRSRYEAILLTVVVALVVAVSIGIYARRSRVDNGRIMISELSAMRSGIALYRTLNGANPPSLDVLVSESYNGAQGEGTPYLEHLPGGNAGAIIDPFGNRYSYDEGTGWVRSTTEGYEYW